MSGENVVFRGTMMACFDHFKRQFEKRHPKASKGASEAKEPLAAFCGVRYHTVTRWFGHEQLPQGEVQFRLICFLQVQGYIVNELQSLSATALGLLELIGYGVLTVDQMCKHIGFPSTKQLFGVLRGQGNLVNGRAERGWALFKQHRPALKSKKEAAHKQPPYKFGAVIGAPLEHRALLGSDEI